MPGVHIALHRIAALLRFLLNPNGYDWAARGELRALLRHEVTGCTAGLGEEAMIQPWCRATCPCTAGASPVTVGSQARRRRRKGEPHARPTAGNDGYG